MQVLIADDHAVVRAGLVHLLKTHKSVKNVIEANDGQEAYNILINEKIDLAVLDISMPKLNGLEVLQKITNEKISTKLLILSIYPEKEYAVRAIKLGASGYITKDQAADELLIAIDSVIEGKNYISKEFASTLIQIQTEKSNLAKHHKLSDQEYNVFIKLSEGKKISEIAEQMHLSVKTISTYKSRIFEKLEIKSISELVVYAIDHKLMNV